MISMFVFLVTILAFLAFFLFIFMQEVSDLNSVNKVIKAQLFDIQRQLEKIQVNILLQENYKRDIIDEIWKLKDTKLDN